MGILRLIEMFMVRAFPRAWPIKSDPYCGHGLELIIAASSHIPYNTCYLGRRLHRPIYDLRIS